MGLGLLQNNKVGSPNSDPSRVEKGTKVQSAVEKYGPISSVCNLDPVIIKIYTSRYNFCMAIVYDPRFFFMSLVSFYRQTN